MKIVFMGTPEFALPTLRKLAASPHEIPAVVTQPDRPKGRGRGVAASPVKQFAIGAGIDVLQPEKCRSPEFVEILKGLAPDLVVVVAFGQILSAEVLAVPRLFCMNLHSSILPRYRGAAPINRAIINGDRETGITTMKMDTGLDTGDILLIRHVPIADADTAETLHDRLADIGAELVLETIARAEAGTLQATPQDDAQATYAPKLNKEEGLIEWTSEAADIRNLARGLFPWPGAFTFHHQRRLMLCHAQVAPGEPGDRPGRIERVSEAGIEVGTGRGRLVITELKPEGKKQMTARSFLAGNKLTPGELLQREPRAPDTKQN
jgi:methionyl-tRNA formyltransferase